MCGTDEGRITRSLSIPARSIVLLVLGLCYVACHSKDHHCQPSSCGDIHNISYPFRLDHDPEKCGDSRYNLFCENNLTVLYLYSGKYYVRAINYENYTIRVVDAKVREGNCSSIPRYSLTRFKFSDGDPYSMFQKIAIQTSRERLPLSSAIIFISCETQPVNSPPYVDTAPCFDAGSRHSFLIIRSLNVSDLMDSCRIELMVSTSSWIGTNSSYIDIHNGLLYGFELSWLQIYDRLTMVVDLRSVVLDCYVDIDTNKVNCDSHYKTVPHLQDYPVMIGIAVLACIAQKMLAIPCAIVYLAYQLRRRHFSMYGVIEEFLQSHNNLMPIKYSYSNIKKITKGFKDKLGEGSYGSVYKGKLRSGRLAAIKMLGKSKANGQDFFNEVSTIGRIHHVNVVQLIGYCA